jgi:hypothetical protein
MMKCQWFQAMPGEVRGSPRRVKPVLLVNATLFVRAIRPVPLYGGSLYRTCSFQKGWVGMGINI